MGAMEISQVLRWIEGREDEHTEFKEARHTYDGGKLTDYCVALANEGGGRIIFGVTDKKPREIVGTEAFPSIEQTKHQILQRIHIRVDAEELYVATKRVVVFVVPGRMPGRPLHYKGRYLMRSGESVVPMTPEQLRSIFAEYQLDFSSEICKKATISDLDSESIERFQKLWAKKSGNASILELDELELLEDAELITDGVTYAAIMLFGTKKSISKYLPQAEVIFEYRSSESNTDWQDRAEFREGFFTYFDRLWDMINLRNDVQHFQQGLFMWDLPTFREIAVREALLNAVTHRDYQRGESVFVLAYPRKLEVRSPGGFPPGINLDNILDRQSPRNRRLAEALQKCGLVERSGQGLDRIFETAVKDSKPLPDFSGTDENQVCITLRGDVEDPKFLKFLEIAQAQMHQIFTLKDLLVLNLVKDWMDVPPKYSSRLKMMLDAGVIEKIGAGRGTRYMLSRKFYGFVGQAGHYTRAKGLDKETNKALIIKHIENNGGGGRMGEFLQVLPHLTKNQISLLLSELKNNGQIEFVGARVNGAWRIKNIV